MSQTSTFPTPDLEPLMAAMPAAFSMLDTEGRLVFYNAYAPKLLDRKPEYIGHDVLRFHKPASAAKIRRILDAYRDGGRDEYSWQLSRNDRRFQVRVAPWLEGGRWRGVLHVVMILD